MIHGDLIKYSVQVEEGRKVLGKRSTSRKSVRGSFNINQCRSSLLFVEQVGL